MILQGEGKDQWKYIDSLEEEKKYCPKKRGGGRRSDTGWAVRFICLDHDGHLHVAYSRVKRV